MSKKKILVVDDEPDFLEMIKLRLEANDYEVITASNGEEALRRAEEESPDAVLLDILMPKVDGLEVLKRIRRRNKNLPIFIITAFSTEELFKLANKLHASGFITKVSDLDKEVQNITNALNIADKYKSR